MDPSPILALLLPLTTLSVSPANSAFVSTQSPLEPLGFGRVIEVIKSRGRVDQLHANRLRLSDNVSLGGVFNLFDTQEDLSYSLNLRITF